MTHFHIAIVIDDQFPTSSGVSRSVQTQIEELLKLGHRVTLLVPTADSTESSESLAIIQTPFLRVPGLPSHTSILRNNRFIVNKLCRKHKFDIIHSQTDSGALLLAAKIAKRQHIPHIHTFHTNVAGSHDAYPILMLIGSAGVRLNAIRISILRRRFLARSHLKRNIPTEKTMSRFDWRSQAMIANSVDGITTPAHYMANYINAAAEKTSIKTAVIPNSYNYAFEYYASRTERKRKSSTLRFISIGRVVKEKRLDVMIDAFKQANIPNSELIIVGDGPEYKRLKKYTDKNNNIKMTGHIKDKKDIFQLLRDSDVFVLTSYRFDSQAIVLAEALVAGVPVLYCDDRLTIGVNEQNSILTKPNIYDIANGMQQYADDSLRKKLATGTKSVFNELSPQVMAASYISFYEEILADYQ